jgi:transcriptional regulator with XRE-family HTH domain
MKFKDFLTEQLKDKKFAENYKETSQAVNLGVSLCLRREELGLTQEALSKLTGIKQPMLARIETGQIPKIVTLQKLAKSLDISIVISGNKISIEPNMAEDFRTGKAKEKLKSIPIPRSQVSSNEVITARAYKQRKEIEEGKINATVSTPA